MPGHTDKAFEQELLLDLPVQSFSPFPCIQFGRGESNGSEGCRDASRAAILLS